MRDESENEWEREREATPSGNSTSNRQFWTPQPLNAMLPKNKNDRNSMKKRLEYYYFHIIISRYSLATEC